MHGPTCIQHLSRRQWQLACYDGNGSKYDEHADMDSPAHAAPPLSPPRVARRLTAIYYMSEGWAAEDGGGLRLRPAGGRAVVVALAVGDPAILRCR
jgi:Rps23 Pro-64 3,4-dihydroxylase Tpa1-like proline 4-hydroxylase